VKRDVRLLASLNCDGRRGLLLVLALATVLLPALGGRPWQLALRYERAGLRAGQLWRLLTAHLVHLDLSHALLNAAGLLLLWVLFARLRDLRFWLQVVGASVLAIDSGLWWSSPEVGWYVGASGLLHGVMAAGVLCLLEARDRLGLSMALLLMAKLGWERAVGPLPLGVHGAVVAAAHLYGSVGGAAVAGLSWAYRAAIMRAPDTQGRA
jgi:rhomboid family GlyGly-CTERM serine protease